MSWKPDDSDEPARDVFSAQLTRRPGPGGQNPVAQMLADEVASALRALSERRTEKDKAPLSRLMTDGLPSLTATAIGAIEGTLKSKSLDGALKEAQILAAYADARQKNAAAENLEADTDLKRLAAARERLSLALEACKAFGVDPAIALAGDDPAIALGDGLISKPHERELAAGAEPTGEGEIAE